ncbi:MAG: iron-regulated protein [Synechococcales cyanobacterium RU_4_20]|nr:iron-regulated protein [Synechococcales cyanobacterium RU_4_20]NJR67294.1 iron-regulated protein [Synechococcales cyanobacterium CRU_2_2]
MGLSVRSLAPEIFLFEQLLTPLVCQHLIEISQLYPPIPAGVELGRVEADIRSNGMLRLEDDPLLASTNELLLAQVSYIQNWLHGHYGIRFTQAEACSILCYDKGQFYQRHVDNLLMASRECEAEASVPTRDISIVGYLNEGFEGGETYFDRQELKVVPQLGSVLVFPSFYAYPHQSLPVITGRKYAWTTWLYF